MDHPSPSGACDPAEQEPEDAARRRRNLAMLDRLAEIGMRIAERAGERALRDVAAETGPEGTGDGGRPDAREAEIAFDRAARTVRGIVALQHRIATGHTASAAGQPARRPADPPAPWPRTERLRRLLDWAMREAPDEPGLLDIRREFDARLVARVDGPELVPGMASRLIRQVFETLPRDVLIRIGEFEDEQTGPDRRGPEPP